MVHRRIRKSFGAALRGLVQEYRDGGGKWPVDALTIAADLLAKRRVELPCRTEVQILAKHIQKAMNEEHYTDPQGRRVHKKLAFPVTFDDGEVKVQKMLWCDIETATPDQVRLFVGSRRKQVQGDVHELKLVVDSYNDNNSFGATIQLSLNFEKDMQELEHDTEYRPLVSDDSESD